MCWWGTEYVRLPGYNLANFHKTSFFDYQGNALPVMGVFGGLTSPIKLDAELNGDVLSLKWPFSGAGLKLSRATDISPTADWAPVTNMVRSTGEVFNTTLPLGTSPSGFYRLQSD